MTIDRASDPAAMEEYNSSFSLKGVCVEVCACVRPRMLVKTLTTAYATGANTPATIMRVRKGQRSLSLMPRPFRVLVCCSMCAKVTPITC